MKHNFVFVPKSDFAKMLDGKFGHLSSLERARLSGVKATVFPFTCPRCHDRPISYQSGLSCQCGGFTASTLPFYPRSNADWQQLLELLDSVKALYRANQEQRPTTN